MRTATVPALVLLAGLLGASLTGCAVSITDAPDAEDTASSATNTPIETDADNDANDTAQDAGDPTARAEVRSTATTTAPCDGALTLERAGAVVAVEGDCDHLTVSADGSTIVAEDVTTLEIIGTGNVVYTDALTTLAVSGNANVVHWLGAEPTISDDGAGNALTAG